MSMAFAGVSVIDDGKLCASTASPVDAGYDDSGYHLLVVQGYTRTRKDTPTGEYVESRPFKVGGVRFLLRCYPNGWNEDAKEFISVTLDFGEQDLGVVHLFPVSVRCAISLIDQTAQQASSEIKRGDETYISGHECLYEDVVRRDVLERSRHLKNDSFTIRCDVVVCSFTFVVEKRRAGTITTMPWPDMPGHFSNLLLTKKGSDITFEVGGKMIAAHRCVLGARSSVFMEQFFGAGVMNEGATATSVVKIDGIKETVFRGLLTYVYTDALPYIRSDKMEEDEGEKQERNGKWQVEAGEEEGETDEEKTDEEETDEEEREEKTDEEERVKDVMWFLHMLEAADRYDFQSLKMSYEEALARSLCVSMVADIIVGAEQRRCQWLKEVCLQFINSHTSLPSVFTPEVLEMVIRTSSLSGLKELISKFAS